MGWLGRNVGKVGDPLERVIQGQGAYAARRWRGNKKKKHQVYFGFRFSFFPLAFRLLDLTFVFRLVTFASYLLIFGFCRVPFGSWLSVYLIAY